MLKYPYYYVAILEFLGLNCILQFSRNSFSHLLHSFEIQKFDNSIRFNTYNTHQDHTSGIWLANVITDTESEALW